MDGQVTSMLPGPVASPVGNHELLYMAETHRGPIKADMYVGT